MRTSLVAADLLVRALGFVAFGDDGREVAAGGAVAFGSLHVRHCVDVFCVYAVNVLWLIGLVCSGAGRH